MAAFIVSGSYDRHIRAMRAQYRHRREQLAIAVTRASPNSTVAGMPAGLHVMLELADGDESALSGQLAWRRLGVEGLDFFRHPKADHERDGLVIGVCSARTECMVSGLGCPDPTPALTHSAQLAPPRRAQVAHDVSDDPPSLEGVIVAGNTEITDLFCANPHPSVRSSFE
jgi:hypothetical protein